MHVFTYIIFFFTKLNVFRYKLCISISFYYGYGGKNINELQKCNIIISNNDNNNNKNNNN